MAQHEAQRQLKDVDQGVDGVPRRDPGGVAASRRPSVSASAWPGFKPQMCTRRAA